MPDPFLAHAGEILDAARSSASAGEAPSEMVILIGRRGEIRIVSDPDRALDALRRERGSEMAFRVSGRGGRVTLEGLADGRGCHFEYEPPAALARRLLNRTPYCPPPPALPAGR